MIPRRGEPKVRDPRLRPMKRLLLLLVLPLLAACGGNATLVDPAGEVPRPPMPADRVVVRIYDGPGFTSAYFAYRTFATLTIMGDGRVYTQAPVPAIYPGPAVLPVLTGELTPAQLDEVVTAIRNASLLREVDYGEMQVSDAGTTDVTVNVDGRAWAHSAYALDIQMPQSADRKALAGFITKVQEIAGPVANADFKPVALVAHAQETEQRPTSQLKPTIRDWPGAAPLVAVRCEVISDTAVVKTIVDGTDNTYYRDGGKTFQVAARPLLPGDPGCSTS